MTVCLWFVWYWLAEQNETCSPSNRILSSKNLVFRFSMLPSCNLLVYAIWFLLYLIFARSTTQNFPAMIAWMCQWISDSESGAGDLKCRDAYVQRRNSSIQHGTSSWSVMTAGGVHVTEDNNTSNSFLFVEQRTSAATWPITWKALWWWTLKGQAKDVSFFFILTRCSTARKEVEQRGTSCKDSNV